MSTGPARGYFPNPTKSILVVLARNIPWYKYYLSGMGINAVTESRYLGVYIGNADAKAMCLGDKVDG